MWRQSANHSLSLLWASKTAPWEFKTKLLHYFFTSNNKSNLHFTVFYLIKNYFLILFHCFFHVLELSLLELFIYVICIVWIFFSTLNNQHFYCFILFMCIHIHVYIFIVMGRFCCYQCSTLFKYNRYPCTRAFFEWIEWLKEFFLDLYLY